MHAWETRGAGGGGRQTLSQKRPQRSCPAGAWGGHLPRPWSLHTCDASSLRGLLDFLLVVPPELREAVHLYVGVSDAVADLPEAGEVVPVWDFSIKHGRLEENKGR